MTCGCSGAKPSSKENNSSTVKPEKSVSAEKEHDKALKAGRLYGYPRFMETMRQYGGYKWQNA